MKLSFAILVSLLFVSTFADTCLERVNPVGEGSACSPVSTCAYGLFCATGKGREGKCIKKYKAGEKCFANNECGINHSCVGPTDNKICVKNANPGESCSTTSDSTVARCLTRCDSVTNKCTDGNVGDVCTADADCLKPLTCGTADGYKDKVCIPLADGVNCTVSLQCKPNSICLEAKCTPKKISGECNSAYECDYSQGFMCTRKSEDDRSQCLPIGSFVAGSYCESNEACESKRCYRGFCATKEAPVCSNSNDCASDQTCRCSGNLLSAGYGTCVTNPCYKASESYSECVIKKCHADASVEFDNSCAYVNCGSKYVSLIKCSSASSVAFSVMTIVFALFAVAFVF